MKSLSNGFGRQMGASDKVNSEKALKNHSDAMEGLMDKSLGDAVKWVKLQLP